MPRWHKVQAAGADAGADVQGFVADFSSLADVHSLAAPVQALVPRHGS
jgi:hypothetical protein